MSSFWIAFFLMMLTDTIAYRMDRLKVEPPTVHMIIIRLAITVFILALAGCFPSLFDIWLMAGVTIGMDFDRTCLLPWIQHREARFKTSLKVE